MWIKQGLEASWLHISYEEFCRQLRGFTVFVAQDQATGELLGMHCLKGNKKHRWVSGFRLAVSPSAQDKGVASKILAYEVERLRQAGYRYLKGSTATTAIWSVNWHLKNGYRIIGYYHSPNDNFANYVFRKQLVPVRFSSPNAIWFVMRHPVYALYSCTTFCLLRFWLTYAITRIVLRR